MERIPMVARQVVLVWAIIAVVGLATGLIERMN